MTRLTTSRGPSPSSSWDHSWDSMGRPETGNRKPETGNRKPETGNRKPETGNRKPETGNRNQLIKSEFPIVVQRRSGCFGLENQGNRVVLSWSGLSELRWCVGFSCRKSWREIGRRRTGSRRVPDTRQPQATNDQWLLTDE
jgi:hypothetical protein